MPIAGPVSILITSNALKGRLKYCNLLATGASVADFIYVLVAVYGISHIIAKYKAVIPYILGAGSIFILLVGIRIIRTRFDIEHIDEETRHATGKAGKMHGALYTGFMVNFLNPTLFFGWLISSFIVLSFAASLGFDTSGLNTAVDQNLDQIEKIDGNLAEKPKMPSYLKLDTLKILRKENHNTVKPVKPIPHFRLLVTIFYSAFLAIGSILWFSLLSFLVVRFRKRININVINWTTRSMGIILCGFAAFFVYTAVKILL